ncbi:MAG: vWA domain-containing protein [Pseudomonadota bacterium]|nr:vWA domain-containing protein [Pseudomonadota bacterium]
MILALSTLLSATLLGTAHASPGVEMALVLDTSCSMATGARVDGTNQVLPPNDPERAAVLGTLVVEGLARGSTDRVTVIGFGADANADPPVVTDAAAIRALPYSGGTFFRRPLEEARRRLEASDREGKLLLFFTDGSPSDVKPDESPRIAGLDTNDALDTVILGLFGSEDARQQGEIFLRPMARTPDALTFMNDASQVLRAFTNGYARALGSHPEVGTLASGASKTFAVPRFVVEVLAMTASTRPGPAYTATLAGPKGPVPVQAQGDNGCPRSVALGNAPTICDDPRRHYVVFRAPNDPNVASEWTLAVPSAPGDVEYGVILRYDLVPSLVIPPRAQVGDTVPIEAELLFRGQTFDDAAFFSADGFKAVVEVDGQQIPLTQTGDGHFRGSWSPSGPSVDGRPVQAQVRFTNTWLDLSARRPVAIEGFLDLTLAVNPNPLDLGRWRGERGGTRRCATLDLSGSTNADRVPVTCTPSGFDAALVATCTPVPGSEATVGSGTGQPLRWEVCAEAPGCCDAAAGTTAVVTLMGANPHYAPGAVRVPVGYTVDPTGFLRCWWPWIAGGVGTLTGLWLVVGFLRPHDFDPAATVRIAGSEAGLKRGTALVLREQPGGRRGFYRDGRACLSGDGDFLRKPGLAILVLEAGAGGSTRFRKAAGLEKKNRRTGKWEPVETGELTLGYTPGVVYRVGNLHVKFE